MTLQLWEENTYLPDALLGEIRVVLDMFQSHPTNPLELTQVYGFRHQITRAKVRICYRPKALIEAQRPTLGRASSAIVPVALNTTNTSRNANSPARSLTLNSKIVSTAEIKELVDILDTGLTEALRAPDLDHIGSDPVWDWSIQSNLPSSGGLSTLTKDQRYSTRPVYVDDDLPVFMMPISMELGLPPSTNIRETWMDQHTKRIMAPTQKSSGNPGAVSAEAPPPAPAAEAPTAPLQPVSATAPADQLNLPPPPSRPISSSEAEMPSLASIESRPQSEPVTSATSRQDSNDAPPIDSSEILAEEGDRTLKATTESMSWARTLAPSEHMLEPLMEDLTGKAKLIQSQGNTARDRRRQRRATFDSKNPPEFKDIDLNNDDTLPATVGATPESADATPLD